MILEQNIPPFSLWIGTAALEWLLSLSLLLGVALGVGLLLSIVRFGFGGFWQPFLQGAQRGLVNITHISMRRIWAITRLSIKESIRRRVLFVFGIFMVILLFGGWFLDPNSEDPAKLYMTFVLSATTILVMLLSLFLSAFSLPTDFKTKTIYTVVTKPVRSSELVFGRILGISLVGTGILVLMATCSYFFVTSGLQHTHLLTEKEDLTPVSLEGASGLDESQQVMFRGETRLTNGHKHPVTVYANGQVALGDVNGHVHHVSVETLGDKKLYNVEMERGTLQARVPIYGKLNFRGKDGLDTDKGINVGDEWEYRSFIGGTSKQADSSYDEAAVFTFSGLTPSQFPKIDANFEQGIPVEMTLGVFRTHKGDIEKRVNGSISLRNPKTGLKVEVMTFSTEEFITKAILIPWTFHGTPQIVQRRTRIGGETRMVPDDAVMMTERQDVRFTERREFNLFNDFVADGSVELWLQCIDSMQYIGVAQADLYLRADDGSVPLNFVKGFYSIWMRMIIVIAFGVLFSTFLSGAVAMISTIGVMIAGFSKSFMIEIGLNKVLGGGPFESLYRLLIQQNMVVDLPKSFATTFIQSSDKVYSLFMRLLGQAIPPLSEYAVYDTAVVAGFNIPFGWILVHSVMTFAYIIPIFIAAYLILSNREVAKS
ncbi:MAG: ABC transporter permease [Thermoguttaceae bacterium]